MVSSEETCTVAASSSPDEHVAPQGGGVGEEEQLNNGRVIRDGRGLSMDGEEDPNNGIVYVSYSSESQMPGIMKLIQKDLSEPYSIYTYRYFIHNWPKLCFLAMDLDSGEMVGAIVCKLDVHKQVQKRGYIAMLAVDEGYRRKKIGKNILISLINIFSL